MDAEKYNLGTFVKDVLRTVAVVHVKVDDQNFGQVMSGSGMMSGQSNIVEKAETHAPRRRGMMTWRTHQTERVLAVPLDDGIDRNHAGARRGQGN